ncbi:MAG: YggT family protein [Nitriliruptoraceae bacterium]
MGGLVCFLLQIYWFVLLAYVVFSWIPRPPEPIMPFVAGVRRLVEPVAAPVRRVLPPVRLGGVALDLSILVVFFGVIVLQRFVCSLGL